ncbi:sulfatase-like hydrolase/transferase [Maribellus comscasis]|uniref:Sulfatase-like hydrolase/transferase n=1 Tax=Maribellus comscasis TaxID=2681766 RepID=A0A6I6JS94_9BACT|nr:sulfatase [Maribellus comscasis]QGY43960.1 sulfatase-like hydrolase/transferase [Maribellus comscasis]
MKKITIILFTFLFSLVFTKESNAIRQEHKPNILIIVGDDCTYNDLPLYGGKNVKTPSLDKLASEGMTFNKAFLSMSMCAPCRAELYTGLYPVQNGVCWNYVPARTGTKSIVHYLKDFGYRVGIAGKIHAEPQSVFPFEKVEGLERDCVAKIADFDETGMRNFINKSEDPFCLIVGLVVPHIPWTVGTPSHFTPKNLDLPPNFPDVKGVPDGRLTTKTKSMREDFINYLAEIEVMDKQVGKTLDLFEDLGKSSNTIVIFTSEQGSQFPGNKYTNWNTGVHTGFIVRWPGNVEPGVRTNALIQYADVLPTLIDVVGGNSQEYIFSGSSFLPVLLGESNHHRKYAYFMHNNIPEGTSYPIRSITDGKYHYINNLTPERIFTERHIMSGQGPVSTYWASWMWDAYKKEQTYWLISRYMKRPEEELYIIDQDQYELNNLINYKEYKKVRKSLSTELARWMNQERDPGKSIDKLSEVEAAFKGNHFER